MPNVQFTDSMKQFLKKPNFMVLGTLTKDGAIQMTPVWYEFTGEKFKVSTTTPRIKHQNLKRDSRCTFVIQDHADPYRYIQVRGEATDITKENAHQFIDQLSKKYFGKTPYPYDPDHEEDRVIITITPQKLQATGFDGE